MQRLQIEMAFPGAAIMFDDPAITGEKRLCCLGEHDGHRGFRIDPAIVLHLCLSDLDAELE